MKYKNIPTNVWIKIILVNPSDCQVLTIPKKEAYILYNAILPNTISKREFTIIFPYNKFSRAIRAIKPEARKNITKPVMFEFMKTNKGDLLIKNFEQTIESSFTTLK